ncbi:hypothetical protein ACNKHP_09005 [Shigella boydii]
MIKLGIVMDPIANINIKKDSSFAMLLEAQRRGYELHYMEMGDLYLINGEARARYPHAEREAELRRVVFVVGDIFAAGRFHRCDPDVQDPPFDTELILRDL